MKKLLVSVLALSLLALPVSALACGDKHHYRGHYGGHYGGYRGYGHYNHYDRYWYGRPFLNFNFGWGPYGGYGWGYRGWSGAPEAECGYLWKYDMGAYYDWCG